MNAENKQERRDYSSPLRADQANRTRVRILEAFAEQLVDVGAKDVSVERVARAADVSMRTVYHHFATREALFDAVKNYQRSLKAVGTVASIDDDDQDEPENERNRD